jgi:endonuclease-8
VWTPILNDRRGDTGVSMAEGPTIALLKERAAVFVGKRILRVEGDTPMAKERLVGRRIVALRSFGKHFLVQLPTFALRVHLLMFGSYCIDERKDKPIRLGLGFARAAELNFYSCSTKLIEEPLDDLYDWRADVMADQWDPALARRKLRASPDTLVCDALLDQTVFAGVGNIIKNEVLFRIRVHPLSTVGHLPPAKLRELVTQARQYTLEFYEWKKADADGNATVWRGDTLARHWRVHNGKICPRCEIPLTKAHLGELDRRSFHCENCQRRYG